ncbi:MAG: helix-turn-helix domain-containing protein [Acetobacteraceae bacterium]|nr:helix-turn-helix domain-containing protein [Acetobacteraceae bacterium]
MKHVFQNEAFCAALDAHRLARMMTWKQVAEESGVSASTLTRMQQGKRPDVDGLAALLKWSGLKADDFLGGQEANRPETIAQMTALLRADPKLSEAGKKAMEGVLRSAYESLRNV